MTTNNLTRTAILAVGLILSLDGFAAISGSCRSIQREPDSTGIFKSVERIGATFFAGDRIVVSAKKPSTDTPTKIMLLVNREVVDVDNFPGTLHYRFLADLINIGQSPSPRFEWAVDVGGATWQADCTPGPVLGTNFNGDVKSDLPWRNPDNGQNRLWLMDGPVRDKAGAIPTIGPNWEAAGTGDFNQDGRADFFWHNTVTGANRIWFMAGTTRTGFAPLPRFPDTRWQVAAICDLNRVRGADVIWRHATLPRTRVWIMDGVKQDRVSALPVIANNWIIVACADFDGDGTDDILWRDKSNGRQRIWFLQGFPGRVSMRGAINNSNKDFRVGGVGDFTGDGKADILYHNDANGRSQLWEMDGLKRLSSIALPLQRKEFTGAAIGDYGGDGKLDIFWRNSATGANQIWNMDGAKIISREGVVKISPAFDLIQ